MLPRPRVATVALAASVLLAACVSRGPRPAARSTTAELSRANYRVVATDLRGRDTGFRLFGILPFVSPSYADAMSELRDRVDMSGRATALVNVTEDESTLYLVLFSLPRVTVTADVVEFLEEKPPPPPPPPPPTLPPPPPPVASAGGDAQTLCLEATPGANWYDGQAHPLRVRVFVLSSPDAFWQIDSAALLEPALVLAGLEGAPVEHVVPPGGRTMVSLSAGPAARFVGVAAHYERQRGSARGYRPLPARGQAVPCVKLGAEGIEGM
jgi:type VI secretion system VasD/TssJ family lipoprotein